MGVAGDSARATVGDSAAWVDPSRAGLLGQARLALKGLQFDPKYGSALGRDVSQVIIDARLAPLPPVGLIATADIINAAGEVDVRAIEVLVESIVHLHFGSVS